MKRLFVILLTALVVTACATSPTGRRTIKFMPAGQMDAMGVQAYAEMKQQTPATRDSRVNNYVQCVARNVTNVVGGQWEITVFADDQANAFALPGGKIGVYTGLLKVAENQSQLAAVIGHEIVHVTAEHSNERVSTSTLANSGMQVVQVLAGEPTPMKQQLLGLLGVGTQVGILLPFGRAQESEADILGIDLMARAGFDPRESVQLWINMSKNSNGAPPEFMSTHPSSDTRIRQLQERMDSAMQLYRQAQAQGRRPNCG